MQDETQATHLAKTVHTHHRYPEYTLFFPFVSIKKRALEAMKIGDVVLLGFSSLEMVLVLEDTQEAKVSPSHVLAQNKLNIIEVKKEKIVQPKSKKSMLLQCRFGIVQSRTLEVGHKIDISSISLEQVEIVVNQKCIASAKLVNVDDEIAIEIIEVRV